MVLVATLLFLGATIGPATCRSALDEVHPQRMTPMSTIDLPAVDRVAPPDAVVNVRTEYGATGDGRTDDTAAIQAAISASLGFINTRNKILYFPAGTYLVTRPLEWRLPDGSWSTWLTLMGQNRDRTVIKLADSAPQFADSAAPRAVVVTASQNSSTPDGGGNQAFYNFIFDMTIDVGAGNPGADGIDLMANNRGAVRNVVVRAAPDSGNAGISMERLWPGPALLEDVRIDGFARGVSVGTTEYSVTAEDIRLSGQRVVGMENASNVLTVRHLVSRNAVPAVRNSQPSGLLTVLDSDLMGGMPGVAAVENNGGAFLRDLRTHGYTVPVRDRLIDRYPPEGGEWSSAEPSTLFASSASSLRLPVAEDPVPAAYPADQWAGVDSFGARVDDDVDDTAAIQATLDSGKPVVYLRAGRYQVSSTLHVPATVRVIEGFEAQIDATRGAFAGPSTAAVFSVGDPSSDPLVMSQLLFVASPQAFDVERVAARPIALRDVHISGQPFRGTPGPLFLTNVDGIEGGWQFTPGQQVWARQLNVEQRGTQIRNDGAALWILGLKTERPATVIESMSGARTELFGGLLYPVEPTTDGAPAFVATDAVQSLTVATSAYGPAGNYALLVDATREGTREQLTSDEVEHRGFGSMIVLYGDG